MSVNQDYYDYEAVFGDDYGAIDCRTITVSGAGKPHRNSIERASMLRDRRARQNKRDALVGDYGRQFTPVPKTGWRAKAAAKAAA